MKLKQIRCCWWRRLWWWNNTHSMGKRRMRRRSTWDRSHLPIVCYATTTANPAIRDKPGPHHQRLMIHYGDPLSPIPGLLFILQTPPLSQRERIGFGNLVNLHLIYKLMVIWLVCYSTLAFNLFEQHCSLFTYLELIITITTKNSCWFN